MNDLPNQLSAMAENDEPAKVDAIVEAQNDPKTNEKAKDIVHEEEEGEPSSISNAKGDEALSELKEHEKKALEEFRSRVEEAILMNKLFKKRKSKDQDPDQDEKNAGKGKEKVDEREEDDEGEEEMRDDKTLCLWGVPLMPSKGDSGTDVILLKFLKARDFKVGEALEMLCQTLQWRKGNKIDSILEEDDLASDYQSMASINGLDRRGHPVCYNVYGVFGDESIYNKTFGTPESREKFLRWRLQLMERQIQMLDFRSPDHGKSSLVQINDLHDTPGPSRKDLRMATRQAVALLQENYPEFVSRNIFINVPFWYYAFNAVLSPFLTQRTKSKFVFARANRVTETLLKYISGEEIPVRYGGLKRENDPDFSTQDGASEITVKAGSTEVIEIPAAEAGTTLVWDLTVLGWEVNYKEEFVPSAESSYTVIVKKDKRIAWQEGSIRNSFKTTEPGKIVLTIDNGQFKKKKALYRSKTKHDF